jgi:hypothetical protein
MHSMALGSSNTNVEPKEEKGVAEVPFNGKTLMWRILIRDLAKDDPDAVENRCRN